MNGFHSFGRGINSHEMPSTNGKKIANSTVGKIIVAQLFLLVAAAPAAAIGPCEAQATLAPRHHKAGTGRAPFAVGDSVMLGAADALAHAGFRVNARGCRQMDAGLDIVARRARHHNLARTVVVALGTNWQITRADVARALRIVGRKRRLILVTPREVGGGGGTDAAIVRRAARRHPRRICLADWVKVSAGHFSWFSSADGIHLGPAGVRAFTRLLRVKSHRRGACGG
jgi:hypothetical protein